MQEAVLPYIPIELLEALNTRYPERSPELHWSEREIWMAVGERRVIRLLNEHARRQQDNLLESR